MIELIVAAALAGIFLFAFATRRRFGVLGLGLAAGVVLASQFRGPLMDTLQGNAAMLQPFSPETVATLILVLGPALLLLAGGPRYMSAQAAALGSVGFIIMVLALIIEPLSHDIGWIADNAGGLVQLLSQWQGPIVAVTVAVAVLDMFLSHNPHLAPRSHHRKHG